MFDQIDVYGTSPEKRLSFEHSPGIGCEEGIPAELLAPADEEGVEDAIREVNAARDRLMSDAQNTSRTADNT